MRDYVALILAVGVLVAIFVGSSESIIRMVLGYEEHPLDQTGVEYVAIWADMIKVLIGGLIGYIAGGNRADKP